MHFTAMGAVTFVPDPTRAIDGISLSPDSLSLVIAGAAAFILGMCLVAAGSDRPSKGKLRRQRFLLGTPLENKSPGLCMFEGDGRNRLFNDRDTRMIGMSAGSPM